MAGPAALLERLAAGRKADRGGDPVRARRLQPAPRPVVHRDRGREPEPAQEPGLRLVRAARPPHERPRPPRGGGGDGRPVRGDRPSRGRACGAAKRVGALLAEAERAFDPRDPAAVLPKLLAAHAALRALARRPVGRREAARAPRRDPLGVRSLARGDGGEPVGDAREHVPAERHRPRPRGTRRRRSSAFSAPWGTGEGLPSGAALKLNEPVQGSHERPRSRGRRGHPAPLAARARPGEGSTSSRSRATRIRARRRGAARAVRRRDGRRETSTFESPVLLPPDRPGEGRGDPPLRRRAARDARAGRGRRRPSRRPAAHREGHGPRRGDAVGAGGPPPLTPAIVAAATGEGTKAAAAAPVRIDGTVRLGLPREWRVEPSVRPFSLDAGVRRDVRVHGAPARQARRRDADRRGRPPAATPGPSRSAGSSTRTCRR